MSNLSISIERTRYRRSIDNARRAMGLAVLFAVIGFVATTKSSITGLIEPDAAGAVVTIITTATYMYVAEQKQKIDKANKRFIGLLKKGGK